MNIEIALTSRQTEFDRSVDSVPVVFYGGARGGGKSYGLRSIVLMRCLKRANLHAAIFRRTYEELEANHIRKLFEEHPELHKYYNKTEHLLKLPNGSAIEFCHCRHADDVLLYQGREFEILGIDEVGQWPEGMFQTLRGSVRTTKPDFKPRILLTGNPGGLGHKWLKRLFVDRYYNTREHPEDYAFIAAKVYDNPALMRFDADYVRRLEAEPNEMLRRAFLDGDWDINAGQFFGELSRDVHLIKPFAIPAHWRKFGALDWGYAHPCSVGWFAHDEDGSIYLYRAYLRNRQRPDQIAEYMHRYADTKDLYDIQAGHDCWTSRDGSPTIADQFWQLPEQLRLRLTKANIDRVNGAAELRKRLAHQGLPAGVKGPRLFIFDTADCRPVFDCLAGMIHDERHPEDVYKIDASDIDIYSGDDHYDMIRYACMSRPLKTKILEQEYVIPTVEEERQRKFLEGRARRKKKQQRRHQEWNSVLGSHV